MINGQYLQKWTFHLFIAALLMKIIVLVCLGTPECLIIYPVICQNNLSVNTKDSHIQSKYFILSFLTWNKGLIHKRVEGFVDTPLKFRIKKTCIPPFLPTSPEKPCARHWYNTKNKINIKGKTLLQAVACTVIHQGDLKTKAGIKRS